MKLQARIKEYDLNKYLNDYAFFKDECVYLSSYQRKNELEEDDSKLFQYIIKAIGYKKIVQRNDLTIIQFNCNRFCEVYSKISGCYYE